MSSRRFQYLGDPVCIAAAIIYLVNRLYLKPHAMSGTFGEWYLNDVLCLPLFLPVILYVQRRMEVRFHDGPPRLWEVLQQWAIFSVLFEVILPRFPQYFRTTGDPWDVVAYLVGGMAAWLWWNRETVPAVRRDAPYGWRRGVASPGIIPIDHCTISSHIF